MFGPSSNATVLVYLKAADMRKSFDTLAALASEADFNPLLGQLFVFFNKRRDRLKMLYWEKGGYWLFSRRLEEGGFGFPDVETEDGVLWQIDMTDLYLILEGIELKKVHRKKRFEPVLD
jgi:transposase